MMKAQTISLAVMGVLLLNILVFQACDKKDETNKAPSCDITTPSGGEKFSKGEIVTISVNATDSDGSISEVSFFVDNQSKGSVNSSPYSYDWSTADESIGGHTLKATSVDNGGTSTSDEISIEVIEASNPPVSDFTASPVSGSAPLNVNFFDQSENSPTSWSWDFGDGNSSTDQNPIHTYDNTGTYAVSLN